MKLIDKDALVAEIKRRKELVSDPILSGNDLMIGERNAYFNLLSFIDSMQEEPVSEDLEKELSRLLKDCEIDSEYIHQDFLHIVANHFADWQKERMLAMAVDVTIAIPYPNGYGGYTQLVDSKEALPFGEKVKVIVIKENKLWMQ